MDVLGTADLGLDVYFRFFVCFCVFLILSQFVCFVFLVYFLVFVLSCQYQCKWLPGRNVSEMTYYLLSVALDSSQSFCWKDYYIWYSKERPCFMPTHPGIKTSYP